MSPASPLTQGRYVRQYPLNYLRRITKLFRWVFPGRVNHLTCWVNFATARLVSGITDYDEMDRPAFLFDEVVIDPNQTNNFHLYAEFLPDFAPCSLDRRLVISDVPLRYNPLTMIWLCLLLNNQHLSIPKNGHSYQRYNVCVHLFAHQISRVAHLCVPAEVDILKCSSCYVHTVSA